MGKWVNGTPPFPYRYNTKTRELEVDEINLEIYKLIKRMISSGNSCYKVAEELNTRGIPSKKRGSGEEKQSEELSLPRFTSGKYSTEKPREVAIQTKKDNL